MEVILAPLSPAQLRKFEKGEPVRARLGHHHRVHVSHEHAKKLMSAHKKGAAATIHKHGGRIHLVDVVDNPVVRPVLQASSDRAVQAIEGSGRKHRKHHGGRIHLVDVVDNPVVRPVLQASSDRAVQAIEGSGKVQQVKAMGRELTGWVNERVRANRPLNESAIEGSGRLHRRHYNARKHHTKSDSDEEMEGMGHPKGPGFAAWMAFHGKDTRAGTTYYEKMKAKWQKDHGHGPNTNAKKRERQDEYDQYYHLGAYSDAAIHNRAVAAAKAKAAATAQAQQAATHAQNQASKMQARASAPHTTMPVSHPMAPHPAPVPHPHASHLGGKVNRLKKFNRWFKSIGQKTKTLNHNLKPIKHAASARAADYITMYNNPQAQAQALLDTTQSEASQFRHLAGRRKKASAPSSGMDMSTALVHYLPDAPTTPFPTQYTVQTAEPIPVDYNNDGVPEGYFYPNEKQYFGGKVHKHGKVHHSHHGHSAKKTSPWIAHVKAYAAQHGMKYGEALKHAKSTYKKGMSAGSLYPAGYSPYYDI